MMTLKESAGQALFVSRVFKVGRSTAFRAFTAPEEIKKWWGPKGFTAPSVEIDLRPGGKYHIEMQPPAGPPFAISGCYKEIVPDEKLVFTWRYIDKPGPDEGESLVTVLFADSEDGTKVTLKQELSSDAQFGKGKEEGWNVSFDRLAALLDSDDPLH